MNTENAQDMPAAIGFLAFRFSEVISLCSSRQAFVARSGEREKISSCEILPELKFVIRVARSRCGVNAVLDLRERRRLYAMARVVADKVPEIKSGCACRETLLQHGFSADEIAGNLLKIQHMARVMRGRDADRLESAWTKWL